MNFTPNADHVTALRLVLDMFQRKHETYVCNGLEELGRRRPRLALACRDLRYMIGDRIAPERTVINWLTKAHPGLYGQVWPTPDDVSDEHALAESGTEQRARHREYRMYWILSLIAECEQAIEAQPKENPNA